MLYLGQGETSDRCPGKYVHGTKATNLGSFVSRRHKRMTFDRVGSPGGGADNTHLPLREGARGGLRPAEALGISPFQQESARSNLLSSRP